MEFNKLVLAGLSVGCLAAAAGGSYLAVRQNQTATAISQPSPDLAPVSTPSASKPVTESEGVIAPDAAKPAAPSVEPVTPARPASRIVTATPNRRAETRTTPAPITTSRPASQQ